MSTSLRTTKKRKASDPDEHDTENAPEVASQSEVSSAQPAPSTQQCVYDQSMFQLSHSRDERLRILTIFDDYFAKSIHVDKEGYKEWKESRHHDKCYTITMKATDSDREIVLHGFVAGDGGWHDTLRGIRWQIPGNKSLSLFDESLRHSSADRDLPALGDADVKRFLTHTGLSEASEMTFRSLFPDITKMFIRRVRAVVKHWDAAEQASYVAAIPVARSPAQQAFREMFMPFARRMTDE